MSRFLTSAEIHFRLTEEVITGNNYVTYRDMRVGYVGLFEIAIQADELLFAFVEDSKCIAVVVQPPLRYAILTPNLVVIGVRTYWKYHLERNGAHGVVNVDTRGFDLYNSDGILQTAIFSRHTLSLPIGTDTTEKITDTVFNAPSYEAFAEANTAGVAHIITPRVQLVY